MKNSNAGLQRQGRLDYFAPQGAIYLLEGGTGSVLLLGWFPLSLELFYRAIAETVWNTTDPASEGIPGGRQLGGHSLCRSGGGSVLWAVVLPQFKNTKVAYAVSLVIGGVGFA